MVKMMITYLLVAAFVLFPKSGFATEVGGSKQNTAGDTFALPHCIKDQSTVETIARSVKLNSKAKFKYNSYREALQSDSDAELLARLAYSETKAANCSDLQSKIAPLIVQVIANRIRLRQGDVRSVVFQRDQFASSLNIYASSRYQDFLCPEDAKLWHDLMEKAKAALNQGPSNLDANTVNYFLYKHDPRWKKEPWKLKEDPSKATVDVHDCVRFFVVPNWK